MSESRTNMKQLSELTFEEHERLSVAKTLVEAAGIIQCNCGQFCTGICTHSDCVRAISKLLDGLGFDPFPLGSKFQLKDAPYTILVVVYTGSMQVWGLAQEHYDSFQVTHGAEYLFGEEVAPVSIGYFDA